MRYALITVIESNDNNLNKQRSEGNTHKKGLYEDEALVCFKSWRQKAGWLKDIEIYAYCPTRNTISENTKRELELLGVNYIENFLEETDTYFSGFWNVPLCCKVLEETIDADILIHTDLDMNVIKPLDKKLVDSVIGGSVVCGQYDALAARHQRSMGDDWDLPLDTGLIISERKQGFFKFFYDVLSEATKTNGDKRWQDNSEGVPKHYLEEYVIDKAYNEKEFPIRPLKYYQIGEWYTSVDDLTDTELGQVCFWHEHIDYDTNAYDKIQEKISYSKRMRSINDK